MMVVFFVGTGGSAIATGLTDGPVALALGLAAIGLFGSIYHPVGTAWLVRNTRNRGRALGVNGIAGSVGLATAAFVAGGLAQVIGWRAAFIIPGSLCAATGVALLSCVRVGGMSAQIDRQPEPGASRNDVVRTFIVLSFTMLADGTISQAIVVALAQGVRRGSHRPHRRRDAGGFVTPGVFGRGDGSAGRRLACRPYRDEGGL